MRFFRLFLLLLMVSHEVTGQRITISEPLSIRNDYGYELLGRIKDRILVFRDRFDNFEIQAFDLELRATWNRELEDLEKRKAKVLAVIPGKNDFSIVYVERGKGKYMVRIHKYDPAAILIDTATIKTYSERVFSPPEPELLKSEDRNTIAIYNSTEREVVEIACFRIDQMKLLWDTNTFIEKFSGERNVAHRSVSNEGDVYLVTEYENRKGKIEAHRFQLLRTGVSPEVLRDIAFPDALTSDVKFVIDQQRQVLTGAGLWADKNKERANGVFFIRFDPNTQGNDLLVKTPFDEQFVSVLKSKDIAEGDVKGIEDADVAQLILREDGGVALIAEQHYEIQRGATGSSRFTRDMRLIVDYYYDDVFLVSFSPEGVVQWRTILHKKQYSQDDEAIYSSWFLLRGRNEMQLMFNDEIRYENTCSSYEVSATGRFDRSNLLNTADQGLRLRFRDGIQLSANECIIPSEFRSRLKLVAIRF